MASFECTGIPRCTIDFPLEISPEEIVSLSAPINILLKSSYLLGTSFDTEAIVDSAFDIAVEIAGVEACGYLFQPEHEPESWELKSSRGINLSPKPEATQYLVAPASIATHFDKAVSMDPDWGAWSHPICKAWTSRSLVAFPRRWDRDVVDVLVFGKNESHPFSNVQGIGACRGKIRMLVTQGVAWALAALLAAECSASRGTQLPVPSANALPVPACKIISAVIGSWLPMNGLR